MQEVLHTFGVEWKLLLINAVNFGVLLFILWRFLYRPVVRMLEERRAKVAQGVADAQKAEQVRKEVEGSRADMLKKAGQEADEVVTAARASATSKEREVLQNAEAAAARVLREAEAQAKDYKEAAVTESKQEVAKLIVLGMEKAFSKK